MQQLVYFFQKYKNLLFFLLLEFIAIGLTINNNNFHKSKFLNSTNIITGSIFAKTSQISAYFNLKKQNKFLLEENTKLYNLLEKRKKAPPSINVAPLQFEFVNAKIYKNEYHKAYNFITLNKGKNQGIQKEMAVINSKGIIGITEHITNNYTRVQSILNKNTKINARFKNSHHFGTLIWNGKDYNTVQLTDIPRQAIYKTGDTIITGGKSTIFPEGIPIGSIKNIPKNKTATNTLNIALFNDMSNLGYAYIIKNLHKEELQEIEKLPNE